MDLFGSPFVRLFLPLFEKLAANDINYLLLQDDSFVLLQNGGKIEIN